MIKNNAYNYYYYIASYVASVIINKCQRYHIAQRSSSIVIIIIAYMTPLIWHTTLNVKFFGIRFLIWSIIPYRQVCPYLFMAHLLPLLSVGGVHRGKASLSTGIACRKY